MEIVSFGGERTLEEVLDEGVGRLKHKSTWKLWSWIPENDEFYEAEAFRTFVLVRLLQNMVTQMSMHIIFPFIISAFSHLLKLTVSSGEAHPRGSSQAFAQGRSKVSGEACRGCVQVAHVS